MGQGRPWLVLEGFHGVGKTHLPAAILNARIEHPEWGPPGIWVSTPEFLWQLRRGLGEDDEYDWTLEAYRSVDLLVVDDLGAQYNNRRNRDGPSWAEEQLYMLLNHRMLYRLPTVVSLNSMAEIDARLADRLLSTRNGMVEYVRMEAPSYRSGIKW